MSERLRACISGDCRWGRHYLCPRDLRKTYWTWLMNPYLTGGPITLSEASQLCACECHTTRPDLARPPEPARPTATRYYYDHLAPAPPTVESQGW